MKNSELVLKLMRKKKFFSLVLIIFLVSQSLFSVSPTSAPVIMDEGISSFVEGCKAYSQGDWTSAIFSLKKAASFESGASAETYFMLINAEIYSEDYQSALDDCLLYLENYKNSLYESNVIYLKGRCYFSLAEYDKAVITLSDFCHQYEDHDMYASSLFLIGESFYACYNYDDAKTMYQRVLTDFPDDGKAPACQYRIETISQRDREEKLLYLLKQTGEEYLFAKEEYEKQLKVYSSETSADTRTKLLEAQKKNIELEGKYKALEQELENLKKQMSDGVRTIVVENADELELLEIVKRKASETRALLESRKGTNLN